MTAQSDRITEPNLPRTWYPRRSRLLARLVGVLVLAGLVVLAVALPEDGGWGTGSRFGVAFTGLLAMLFLFVLGRTRVTADRAGVTVVNVARTHRLEWAQIVRVYLRPGDAWVFLDLSDGESLAVMGIQTSNGRERAIEAAAELRRLSEHFAGSEPDSR